jgi:murein endopeptidase
MMRSLVVAVALLAFASTADAKARSSSRTTKAKKTVAAKSVATKREPKRATKRETKRETKVATKSTKTDKRASKRSGKKKRVAMVTRRQARFEIRGPVVGQSLGAPWLGKLREAVQLEQGDGWVLRRPYRAYGTSTTVEIVHRVLADIADRFPDIHAIAVGDISAEHGGRISEHSSHQSGRDIDIGLIFTHKPDAYPSSFVVGTEDNLDIEATFVLVEEFAKTAQETAGVQMIFLDFNVQGLLYNWALANGETEEYLARLFQYPHGRGASEGIVRHEPNHADHIHVRFRCPTGDSACR